MTDAELEQLAAKTVLKFRYDILLDALRQAYEAGKEDAIAEAKLELTVENIMKAKRDEQKWHHLQVGGPSTGGANTEQQRP